LNYCIKARVELLSENGNRMSSPFDKVHDSRCHAKRMQY